MSSSRRLRICILSSFYAPDKTGIGPYTSELAVDLAGRGHQVHVIAAFPFYPEWRQRVPARTLLYRTELVEGIAVTRCRVYVPGDPTPLRRMLHELSWLVSAAGALLRRGWRQDVFLVVSPSFGSAILGALLSRLGRGAVHLHVQDVIPDVALESGQLSSGLVQRLATTLARWTYSSYRSVSALSAGMFTKLNRYTAAARQREMIAPNWVRGEVPHGILPAVLAGRPYAIYGGSFGRKQDLALLSDAAGVLRKHHGPAIVVLGDGPGKENLSRDDSHLIWLGLVDNKTYQAVLRHALAGIVALQKGIGSSVVPSKLAAYLGAGIPVVVAADASTEAANVVRNAACGICVAPGRADLLAESLSRLGSDDLQRRILGDNGRMYAQAHWNRSKIVAEIERSIIELYSERSAGRYQSITKRPGDFQGETAKS